MRFSPHACRPFEIRFFPKGTMVTGLQELLFLESRVARSRTSALMNPKRELQKAIHIGAAVAEEPGLCGLADNPVNLCRIWETELRDTKNGPARLQGSEVRHWGAE